MEGMLIGLNGLKGSGKNAVADILVRDHGFEEASYAALLKQSAAALFGIDPSLWETTKNDPEAVISFDFGACMDTDGACGTSLTAREFLQRYGTEAHRGVFGSSFWVDFAFASLFRDPAIYRTRIVFSDARFGNELRAIHERGGQNVRIERVTPTPAAADSHASEALPDPALIDAYLYNDGTLEDLASKVSAMLSSLDF